MILTWTALLQVEKNVPFALCLRLWGNTQSIKFVRTREAVWVKLDVQAYSCNHCCTGKSNNFSIFWMGVFSLSYPDAMRMRHIVICGLPNYTKFFSLSLKRWLLLVSQIFVRQTWPCCRIECRSASSFWGFYEYLGVPWIGYRPVAGWV